MALRQIYENNVSSYLSQPLSGSVSNTEIYVVASDADKFPQPIVGEQFFVATIENVQTKEWEIVRVTSREGNKLIVQRNDEGSGIKSFPLGSKIQVRVTRETLNRLYNRAADISDYIHQQKIASTDWVINHNLGRLPNVTIEVGTWTGEIFTRDAIACTDFTYDTNNSITLHFSEAVAGRAICS